MNCLENRAKNWRPVVSARKSERKHFEGTSPKRCLRSDSVESGARESLASMHLTLEMLFCQMKLLVNLLDATPR